MTDRQPITRKRWFVVAITGVSVLLFGCQSARDFSLTYRLWNNPELRSFSEPAPNPNLELFSDKMQQDILVQYDAMSEKRETVSRRAYFLQANDARISTRRKPHFVDVQTANRMSPIPLLKPGSVLTNDAAWTVRYPVKTDGGEGFALYCNGTNQGDYDMPVYLESSGTFTRVVLTPFAVTGDTVMVGLVASVAGFLVWLHIGAPGAGRH